MRLQLISANYLTGAIAFWLGQEIVVPLVVRVRSEIRMLALFSYHTHVAFFAGLFVDREVALSLRLNSLNSNLASKAPASLSISNVGNMLMSAHVMRLINAGDLELRHMSFQL